MAFKVHYRGGPWDGRVEESKAAVSAIFVPNRENPEGIYRLSDVRGTKAHMKWAEIDQNKPK